jgi:uncharacterized protein
MILSWVSILILGAGYQAAAAPGAGCTAVRGSVARAICADPKLSRLNRQMRGLYQQTLLVGDRQSRIAEQWSWVVTRDRSCGIKQGAELTACVAQTLSARILELRNASQPALTTAAVSAAPPAPALPGPAAKPTPGCAGASGVIDRAICGDAWLGHWEDRLGKLYQQALDDPSFRAVLADDQQRWIRERATGCGVMASDQISDCVLQATKRRIEQLVQFINSRDEPQDRAAKIAKILSGNTAPVPGLDADTIDRESTRADQSDQVLADARSCIRKNVGPVSNAEAPDEKQVAALVSAACFTEFSRRLSALELSSLAKPSFDMLVHEELSAAK